MIELTVRFQGETVNRRVFGGQQLPVTIGRGAESDMVIDNSMVSRRHAIISMLGTKLVIADQDSDNGYSIRGREDSAVVSELKDGDVVLLGKHEILVGINLVKGLEASERHFKAMPGESIDATVAIEKPRTGRTGRTGSTGRAAQVHKLIVSKPTHRTCSLSSPTTWIGASEVNDIVVRGFGIAHRHLLIYWDGSQHHACDVTGKRKVKVNNEGIDDVVLKSGDGVTLGGLVIEYR